MDGAKGPWPPKDGEVDQGFRADIRLVVELGGAVAGAVGELFGGKI
ncbi:hypothetical protein N8648_03815 [Verrucomicrobia bacterium]|nr:hypothetical protein [Verrucomicrobiota bacterium]